MPIVIDIQVFVYLCVNLLLTLICPILHIVKKCNTVLYVNLGMYGNKTKKRLD